LENKNVKNVKKRFFTSMALILFNSAHNSATLRRIHVDGLTVASRNDDISAVAIFR